MKKTIFTICLILLSMIAVGCQSSEKYFNDVNFDMSRDDVLEAHSDWDASETFAQNYLLYESVTYNGVVGQISYLFDASDQLITVIFEPEVERSERDRVYADIVNKLTKGYGEPKKLNAYSALWKIESEEETAEIATIDNFISNEIMITYAVK